jgi:hypothetical protein
MKIKKLKREPLNVKLSNSLFTIMPGLRTNFTGLQRRPIHPTLNKLVNILSTYSVDVKRRHQTSTI